MDINTILTLVYVASILLTFLFAFIGFFKGMWRTAIAFGIELAILIIIMVASPYIAKAIGNIDLRNFQVNQTITISGTQIQITSVRETLCEILTATGYISPVQGQTIYQAGLALTDSVLALAVYILISLLSIFFTWPLALFFYHSVFKWIIPKRVRNRHKVRWAGLAIGTVMGLMTTTLIISPFSSLAKVIKANKDSIETAQEKYGLTNNQYINYVKVFGDSIYGYGWVADDWILGNATNVSFNGKNFNFNDISQLVTDVSGPFSQALNSQNESDLFNYTMLMVPDKSANLIFDAMIRSNLILGIMPALCIVATNYATDTTGVDLSSLDFSNIDYKNELETLKDIYGNIYSAGLIQDSFDAKKLSFSFSQDNRQQVIDALKEFGDLEIIKKNMPYLCSLTAQNIEKNLGYSILSKDVKSYENIDWSRELQLAGNTLFDMASVTGENISLDTFTSSFVQKFYSSLDNPNNVTTIIDSIVGTDSADGLLDSQLLNIDNKLLNYSQIFDYLFKSVPTLDSYVDEATVIDSFSKMDNTTFKNEVKTILNLASPLKKISDISYETTHDYSKLNIDLNNERQVENLKQVLTIAEKSTLVKNILPSALRKSMSSIIENTFKVKNLLGLSPSSFDFDNTTYLFKDLRDLLDNAPKIIQISTLFNSGKSNKEIIDEINIDDLKTVLNLVANSKVLNPDIKSAITGETHQNSNIADLIIFVFKSFNVNQWGLNIPEKTTIEQLNWTSLDSENKTEVDRISDFFSAIKTINEENGVSSKGFEIKNIKGESLANLLYATSQDGLLKDSLPNLLNSQVNTQTSKFGLTLNYGKENTDWKKASENLGRFTDLIKPWIENSKIDYSKLKNDAHYLNAILTHLKETGFTDPYLEGENYHDPIGDFVFYITDHSDFLNTYHLVMDRTLFYSINPKTGQPWEDNTKHTQWKWISTGENGEELLSKVDSVINVNGETIQGPFTITASGEIKNISQFITDYFVTTIKDYPNKDISFDQYLVICQSMDQSGILRTALPELIEGIALKAPPFYINDFIFDNSKLNAQSLKSNDPQTKREEELNLYIELFKYAKGGFTNKSVLQTLMNRANLVNWDSKDILYRLEDGSNKEVTGKEFFQYLLKKIIASDYAKEKKEGKSTSSEAEIFEMIYSTLYLDRYEFGYYSDTWTSKDFTYNFPTGTDYTNLDYSNIIIPPNTLKSIREIIAKRVDTLTKEELTHEGELIVQVINELQSSNPYEIEEVFSSKNPSPSTIQAIKNIMATSKVFQNLK